MFEGKAGAWPNLGLEALRDFQYEAGRNKRALAGQDEKRPVLRHGGPHIHAG
jgi:hypothetical protein